VLCLHPLNLAALGLLSDGLSIPHIAPLSEAACSPATSPAINIRCNMQQINVRAGATNCLAMASAYHTSRPSVKLHAARPPALQQAHTRSCSTVRAPQLLSVSIPHVTYLCEAARSTPTSPAAGTHQAPLQHNGVRGSATTQAYASVFLRLTDAGLLSAVCNTRLA
jgi:hypothetical protein